jgi:Thioredoxin reductase
MTSVERFDLVVIGGGPAGMAAAIEARRAGVSVCILEDRPALGGQIHKQFAPGFSVVDASHAGHEYRDGRALIDAVEQSGADIRTDAVVWGIWDKRIAVVRDDATSGFVDATYIVLAPGARDRPMAFPGWTLPGVLTAGGAKSLVATQRVLPGRRILMAGSGPLALAFSAQLLEYGANIVEVVEAAPPPRPASLARLALNARASVLVDAARYRARLLRHHVPFHNSTMIVRAEGSSEVERAVVATVDREWRVVAGTERTIDVDTILLGYGLEASSELSRLCGCRQRHDRNLGGWVPVRDEWMRTSVPGILAVGDGSGVVGAPNAVDEGRMAGIAVAVDLGRLDAARANRRARGIRRRLRRTQRFTRALHELFPVGPGAYELATDDTVVCRCEEVTAGAIDAVIAEAAANPNIIRALTRAGMGRCQGRNCASHIAAAVARGTGRRVDDVEPLTVRPPVKPVRIEAIAEERVQHEAQVEID